MARKVKVEAKRLQGILDSLKTVVDDAINSYHEGNFTGTQAKLHIWQTLDDIFQRLDQQSFERMLFIRCSGPTCTDVQRAAGMLRNDRVVSLRWLGPREAGGQPVFYAALNVPKYADGLKIIDEIEDLGCEVRDWTYGCQRR
jgi:hypothetical protein